MKPLYSFPPEERDVIIQFHLSNYKSGGKVTGIRSGAFGSVYFIELDRGVPNLIVAKCPHIRTFDRPVDAKQSIEKLLFELERSFQFYHNPWINLVFDIEFIHGWPFIFSRFRHTTLGDMIGNPLAWSYADKLISLIMVSRGLRRARTHGLLAHQDLKPQNIRDRSVLRRTSNGIWLLTHIRAILLSCGKLIWIKPSTHLNAPQPETQ
jgi:hypothetical protein